MTGWGFWAVAASLALVVAAVLVAALRKAPRPGAESAEADLAVYKDQLAEIERDLARGTIGAEDATRLRAEVGKRVIEADRLRKTGPAAANDGRPWLLAGVILAVIVPGGLAVYGGLGAPGYPDMALVPRLEALDAGIAGRPSQEAELARLKTPRDAALDERLATELGAMTDPAALQAEFEAREIQLREIG